VTIERKKKQKGKIEEEVMKEEDARELETM